MRKGRNKAAVGKEGGSQVEQSEGIRKGGKSKRGHLMKKEAKGRREKRQNIQVERQGPHTWDRGRGWSGTR
jgi:hypothetical protein